jgi:hypothetical protein
MGCQHEEGMGMAIDPLNEEEVPPSWARRASPHCCHPCPLHGLFVQHALMVVG